MGGGGLAAGPEKVAAANAHLVLIDETGLVLSPRAKRSWAKVGQTPALGADGGHRDEVSVIGAVSAPPAAQRLGLYFATAPGGYFAAGKVVAFLRDLLRHLRGNVAVVWDRGGNHKGPAIRRLPARSRRLRVEMLPPWAPELNPVEPVWSRPKASERANFVPLDVAGLGDDIVDRLIGSKFGPRLLRALWERSELPSPGGPDQ